MSPSAPACSEPEPLREGKEREKGRPGGGRGREGGGGRGRRGREKG